METSSLVLNPNPTDTMDLAMSSNMAISTTPAAADAMDSTISSNITTPALGSSEMTASMAIAANKRKRNADDADIGEGEIEMVDDTERQPGKQRRTRSERKKAAKAAASRADDKGGDTIMGEGAGLSRIKKKRAKKVTFNTEKNDAAADGQMVIDSQPTEEKIRLADASLSAAEASSLLKKKQQARRRPENAVLKVLENFRTLKLPAPEIEFFEWPEEAKELEQKFAKPYRRLLVKWGAMCLVSGGQFDLEHLGETRLFRTGEKGGYWTKRMAKWEVFEKILPWTEELLAILESNKPIDGIVGGMEGVRLDDEGVSISSAKSVDGVGASEVDGVDDNVVDKDVERITIHGPLATDALASDSKQSPSMASYSTETENNPRSSTSDPGNLHNDIEGTVKILNLTKPYFTYSSYFTDYKKVRNGKEGHKNKRMTWRATAEIKERGMDGVDGNKLVIVEAKGYPRTQMAKMAAAEACLIWLDKKMKHKREMDELVGGLGGVELKGKDEDVDVADK